MNEDIKNQRIKGYLVNYAKPLNDSVVEHAEEIKDLAPIKDRIHESAIIDPTAEIDATAFIEANVKIYPYAKIGPGVIIREGSFVGTKSVVGPNCSLDKNTIVGEDCVLGENVHTTEGTDIGNRVKIGNIVILSANNKIGNGVKIGQRVYFRAWVTVKAGAVVGDDVVIDRSSIVGAKAVIGSESVLEDGVNVKTKAQIINSFLGDAATIEPEIIVDNSFVSEGRTIRTHIKDDFAARDGVMGIDPITNPKVKVSPAAAKKICALYDKGAYGKFNEEFLKLIFPGKTNLVRDIRECLESVVEDMQGGISLTRDALDLIDKDAKKSLKLIAQQDKFSSKKLIDSFAIGDRDKFLPGLIKTVCYNFSDVKELLAELSLGRNYVFSAMDPKDKKYKHKYYGSEKALADDLLNSVNINLRPKQERGAGNTKN